MLLLPGLSLASSDEGHGGEHGEHAAAGAHGGGHGAHGPAPINWISPRTGEHKNSPPPFAAMLFNFGALLVVLGILMKKPLAEMASGRYSQITKELEEAAQERTEAQARLRQYETRLASLDDERRRILADIRAEGEAEKARLIAEAKEQAERAKKEAEFLISQEMKQLRSDLEKKLVDLTLQTAEAAINVGMDDSRQKKFVDDFIASLGAPAPTGERAKS
jgi:F-type H+-transporting ATPase subunit b